jgi:putative tricarboxylic transport membrane protein
MKKSNFAFIAVILAIISYVGYTALGYPKAGVESGFGSGIYPLVLVAVIFVLCMVLLFMTIYSKKIAEQTVDFRWETLQTPLILTIAILVFALLLERIGFLLDGFFLLFVALKAMKASWKATIITTFVAGSVIYSIFALLLKIPLPTGTIWGGW